MTPVAILVRVSTLKQETDRQIRELTEVCLTKGWRVVEVIQEKAITGSARKRPDLDRVIELARNRTIQKVVVHEVSRVSRRNGVAHNFLDDLEELGVSLYWHAQSIETLLPNGQRNPAASLMFALLADIARNERVTTIERIKSGIAQARANGKNLGRPKGSTVDPDEFLIRHKAVAQHLARGRSVREVAKITDRSPGTVMKVKRLLARDLDLDDL